MNISLRAYRSQEFEKAAKIRQITNLDHLDRWRSRMEKSGTWDDHYLHLAIDVDGELVGDLQVRHCSQAMPDGVLELGLELASEMQGKGIGTEVLKLAAEKFFAEGAHRISGSTDQSNKAMIRAFQKAGWIHEGTLRGLFNENGKFHDYESYSILNKNI